MRLPAAISVLVSCALLATVDAGAAPGPLLAVSAVVVIVMLIGGLTYFRQTERTFADLV